MQHFHYIFTGSGLAALMTVYQMIISGKFAHKTVLLLDENSKKTDDRTWCFWDENQSFEELVSKKWNAAIFANKNFKRHLTLKPYQYKMIRGLDFYNHVFELISKQPNIHFINQKIIDFEELGNHCVVKTEKSSFTCNQIFNSIFNPQSIKNQTNYPLLQQHFIGWFIQSKEEVFDEKTATFMDFSVEQKGNTRFMYVLPTSKTEALLEYTLFSADLLSKKEYESEIEQYIKNLGITEFKIVDKEQGNIPMTCYPFWKQNTKNIINIGSAGGWTKASTGFTFSNTMKKSKALVQFLEKDISNEISTALSAIDFRKFHTKDKFWFYDLLFIDVLYKNNALGSKVFSSLFQKGNPVLIFKFLDEQTTFLEDLKVMLKCPTIPFVKALLNRILK